MNARVQNAVVSRLSLRPPQAHSLLMLVRALEVAPSLLGNMQDLSVILSALKNEFPTLEDFEQREFASLCFSLATGVGKTRLMGAFIAYLHMAHGINNFFVLAPNLTIYNKLIADFTRNTPKYVFKGIAEFAQQPPLIITGDNYDQTGTVVQDQPKGFSHDVRINIFNISKINSEVRGGKEPRIKRMREVLGDSYFNHLAGLDDLVLLMDESHRYRAGAGVRAINELKPLFGLELTATPFVESTRGPVPFRNVVVDYPLARAMEDGFVKEPAVVTQRNFDTKLHSAEKIERTKLEDGVRLHEMTKAELMTYARENSVKTVKPFMLVIARDTTHASQLKTLIESNMFYEGRYASKVIQVDSSRTGAEEEAMISRLLAVESADEPTEIVIHVNMLKEGWDVTNLYTIVPLRAANARTLIEQSIGRGLRLPYGKRTGVAAVDRLNIIAHDKFQDIIDEANRGDSPIRLKQVILDAPSANDQKLSVQVGSGAMTRLGLMEALPISSHPQDSGAVGINLKSVPIFTSEHELRAARLVVDVISKYESDRDFVPTLNALLNPEVQSAILVEVAERLNPSQGDLLSELNEETPVFDLSVLVSETTKIIVEKTIDIPRIAVVPTGEITTGFHPFKLGLLPNFQPGQREIVGQELRTSSQFTLSRKAGTKEVRFEDYIVKRIIDFDDIDYFTQAELLYDLASQAVAHYQTQNYAEHELHEIFDTYGIELARLIRAEMMGHFWEKATKYEVHVSRGFTQLKSCNYTIDAGQVANHFRESVTDPGKIKQMLFAGFSRSLYALQKFDSDTERRFSIILERDALKWFKPAKGQFQIYYKLGPEQPEYIPDFVAETETLIFMVETKARTDLNSIEVHAKGAAAARWCKYATDHATSVGSKPWRYLLLPHDEIVESTRLIDFLKFEVKDQEV
jgi:type III restriction enzyme